MLIQGDWFAILTQCNGGAARLTRMSLTTVVDGWPDCIRNAYIYCIGLDQIDIHPRAVVGVITTGVRKKLKGLWNRGGK